MVRPCGDGVRETGFSEETSVQLVFHCPACGQANRTGELSSAGDLACVHCNWTRPFAAEQGAPTRCAVCGNADLWRQKDFPQGLGLLLVGLGIIISTAFWAYHRPALAIGTLMAFAAGDLLLYLFMKDVLVCYRCAARFHRADLGEIHPAFNLETAERYRQEARRLDQAARGGS